MDDFFLILSKMPFNVDTKVFEKSKHFKKVTEKCFLVRKTKYFGEVQAMGGWDNKCIKEADLTISPYKRISG